ncbi:hypothetical protein ACM39_02615 [Chryseobacterium sp. FH2]|uniref:hypothetical protein n=1 Tax=Chryseobacterium sp. FH2 TaxID=1674291 RepID=UPI00065ACD8D|nr:hypothetical protein [Chryseobacterium sp. FH2]KMQ69950.1 hypothetical protein ACM39_02615 [Chryseobacterium sp. FH2]
MWYNVDFTKLPVRLLPTFLRKAKMVAWITSLCYPIEELYDSWSTNRTDNLFKLKHNGQICYLRHALNFEFDPKDNGIKIEEGNQYKYQYIYLENVQPRFLGTIYLYQDSDYGDTGVDFIVKVPKGLIYDDYKMRKTIDFYKLASKRYKIEQY